MCNSGDSGLTENLKRKKYDNIVFVAKALTNSTREGLQKGLTPAVMELVRNYRADNDRDMRWMILAGVLAIPAEGADVLVSGNSMGEELPGVLQNLPQSAGSLIGGI